MSSFEDAWKLVKEDDDDCDCTTTDMSGNCLHCGKTSAESMNEREGGGWEDCPGCGVERRIGEMCHNQDSKHGRGHCDGGISKAMTDEEMVYVKMPRSMVNHIQEMMTDRFGSADDPYNTDGVADYQDYMGGQGDDIFNPRDFSEHADQSNMLIQALLSRLYSDDEGIGVAGGDDNLWQFRGFDEGLAGPLRQIYQHRPEPADILFGGMDERTRPQFDPENPKFGYSERDDGGYDINSGDYELHGEMSPISLRDLLHMVQRGGRF
jgi:hypothetical protein